jgi:hypothetical protein
MVIEVARFEQCISTLRGLKPGVSSILAHQGASAGPFVPFGHQASFVGHLDIFD